MSTLYDDDFQSYSVGANPPYGNLYNLAIVQPVIVDGSTVPGLYGDAKTVRMPSLQALIYPTTTPDNTLPAYSELTLIHGLYVSATGGTDEQGTLLEVDSNLGTFSGVQCAWSKIFADGTLGVQMDGVDIIKISDFALLRGGWYVIQHNLTLFDAGGHLACTFELGVDGISVLSGTLVSNHLTSTMPAVWWNNIRIGGCGAGSFMGRTTLYDTVQPIGTSAHPGTPQARITQGVIELVISPDTWRVYEA